MPETLPAPLVWPRATTPETGVCGTTVGYGLREQFEEEQDYGCNDGNPSITTELHGAGDRRYSG
jgi:hypothetical protein